MGKKVLLILLLAALVFGNITNSCMTVIYAADESLPPPHGDSSWKLVFSDEFNGTALDTTKWSYNYPWGNTHNHRAYCAQENVTLSNGLLRIKGENRRHPSAPATATSGGEVFSLDYTSGALSTKGKFEFTTGYIEGRFKMPSSKGFWPAFWTLNADGKWPPEIDILEVLCHAPNELHTNYHYGPSWDNKWSYYQKKTVADLSKDFHTFAVEWAPGSMKWYLDGVQLGGTFTDASWIAQAKDMYLIINMAIGGWEDDPDNTTIWPSYYDCDWVRVWQKAEGAVGNAGFESGSLSPWTPWNDAGAAANNARTGAYSLRIGNGPSSAEQVIRVKPNTTYTFSGYGKVPAGQEAYIGVKNYGGSQILSAINSSTYSKGSVTFTTGSTNTQATVFFYHASGTGYCYGDDFGLTQGSTPSSPTSTPASTSTPKPTPTPTPTSTSTLKPTSTPTSTPTSSSKPTPTTAIKLAGYIGPDFSYSAAAGPQVNAGFKVELPEKNISTMTDARGYFELLVPKGDMAATVRVTKPGFLLREMRNISLSRDSQLSTAEAPIMVWAGDMMIENIQDNAINMSDIMEIAKGFNSISSDGRYSVDSDFNRDGAVNMSDVMIAAKHFNATSAGY